MSKLVSKKEAASVQQSAGERAGSLAPPRRAGHHEMLLNWAKRYNSERERQVAFIQKLRAAG